VDTDPLPLVEQELGLLLRRSQAASARLARRVHPDLEPSAYPLLARIAQAPDIRASELAAHFGVGRGTMSRQLARLVALGLIERRTDPDDSRGQLIGLTAEGRRRADDARQARREYVRSALDAWTPDEITELAQQLRRLNVDIAKVWHDD